MTDHGTREFEIRLCGSGGQGLILCARILSEALLLKGKMVAQSQSFEPTSRGGVSRSDLVVGDRIPDYPLASALDALLILDECAADASTALIKDGATVVTDAKRVPAPPEGKFTVHSLPLSETAVSLGSERVTNMVALGALIALTGLSELESVERAVRAGTPKKFLNLNLEAVREGYRMVGPDRSRRLSV